MDEEMRLLERAALTDPHAATALEAQRRTIALVDFLIDKTRLLDDVGALLNERQLKALVRVLREGPEGFRGGLSAANYVAITGATAPDPIVPV